MEEKPKKRLGEILIEDGILSKENLQEALDYQKQNGGGMIGQILVRLGYITEDNLMAVLGKQLSIPYLPLSNYAINTQTVHLLDETLCRSHILIAFDQDEKHLFLAVTDPFDVNLIADLEKQTHLKPQIFLSTPTEIISMLDMTFSMKSDKTGLKKAG
ncbi:MAG: hypothetical protein EXS63_01985 [Candidatus Omnitrophica bacterium]|nr:hypothetical protein [Candidatus Omnitrophota bacterium]